MKNVKNIQCEILGAGAVGHLIACKQSLSGFVCNLASRTISTAETKLIQFESSSLNHEIELCYRPIDIEQPVELLFVCVKSYDLANALNSIKNRLTSESIIVLMQNGMGNLELAQASLEDYLPANNIFIAINSHGALYEKETLKLKHTGLGKLVVGGNYLQSSGSDNEHYLIRQISPELKPSWSNQIYRELWLKLGVNAVINPLTALNQCRNGALLENPALRKHMNVLIDEVSSVYEALELNISAQQLTDYCQIVARNTAMNFSSMMLDYQAQRPLELEAITGYLLNAADKVKIDLKEHRSIYNNLQKG